MVKKSFFWGDILKKITYLDKKQHGTADFPVEYYYVDSAHPRYQMAFHWHNEWELLQVIKGELLLTLNDEQCKINTGEIVLIPGETLHGGEADDCIYECLVFDLYGLFKNFKAVKPALSPFYHMDVSPDLFFTNSDLPLVHVLDVFRDDKSSPCLALEAIAAIAELFAWIIKEKRYHETLRKNGWSTRIKPVLEYIEAHYDEELSLDILSNVACMNSHYFCKVFYSLTNTTPMNYVNFYRMEQAAFLLESTDMNITEIAANCGFWESSYFTKVFKKFKGITPHNYRRSQRTHQTKKLHKNNIHNKQ